MNLRFLSKTLWFLVFIVIAFPGHGQSGKEIQELLKLDTTIRVFMEKWKIPGGEISLVKDGKLIYNRAFGTNKTGEQLTTVSLLKIASLSKTITAVGVLKLVEKGQLDLDEKVFGTYGILNEEKYSDIADSRIYDITLRHLLQHTAGWNREISVEGDPMFHTNKIGFDMGLSTAADNATIFQYLLSKPLDFTPGTQYAYSNLGYALLGRIIEKITGKSYESYIQEDVLHPLGIMDMILAKNDEYPFAKYPFEFINIEVMDSHGGWKATSSDLAKLISSLNNENYYSKTSLATMLQSSPVNPGYGMGCFVNEQGNLWHTGSLEGCSSFMARLSDGLCAVVLFNERAKNEKYFPELDQLVWLGIEDVKKWPSEDLFMEISSMVKKERDAPSFAAQVFPIPAKGILNIALTEDVNHGEIELYNNLGEKVISRKISSTHVQLDIHYLEPGNYSMNITTANQVISNPIIVE